MIRMRQVPEQANVGEEGVGPEAKKHQDCDLIDLSQ